VLYFCSLSCDCLCFEAADNVVAEVQSTLSLKALNCSILSTTDKDDQTVIIYRNGSIDESYAGRCHVTSTGVVIGNVSMSDAGIYTCTQSPRRVFQLLVYGKQHHLTNL